METNRPEITNLCKIMMGGYSLDKHQLTLSRTEFCKLLEYVESLEKIVSNINECTHNSQEWVGTPKRRICKNCGADRTDLKTW